MFKDHRTGVHTSSISVLVLLWRRLIALKRIGSGTFFRWLVGRLIYRGPNLVLYRFFSNFGVVRSLKAEPLIFRARFSFQRLTFPAIFWWPASKFGLFCEILFISTTTLREWFFFWSHLDYGSVGRLLLLFGSSLFCFNFEINEVICVVKLSRKLILNLRRGCTSCIRSSLGLQIAELFGRISCRSCYRWGDFLSWLVDRSCEFNCASRFSSRHF